MAHDNTKSFLVHYDMLKVTSDFIKDSYHLTVEQLQLLRKLIHYTKAGSNQIIVEDILSPQCDISRTALLHMLTQLNQRQWLSKYRNPVDQRRLCVTISKTQYIRIKHIISEISQFMERYYKRYILITNDDYLDYLFKCEEIIKTFKIKLLEEHLTLEELYLLGLLLQYKQATTIKHIQTNSVKQIITLSPTIKKLTLKGYIIKQRSDEDERYITLKLLPSQAPKVKTLIQSCYNHLEKGICKNQN